MIINPLTSLTGDYMKIIVPMGGSNEAFKNEFGEIKPLVNIDGKTLIEHICSMFPENSNFVFICERRYLNKSNLGMVLESINNNSVVLVPMERPSKSVIETLFHADKFIADDEEIIIVHSDSYSKFDFLEFTNFVRNEKVDGALTAFSGFNPCDVKSQNFGRITFDGKFITGIFEKQVLKEGQITAAGCYYFSSWGLFKKYTKRMVTKNVKVKDTFFISLVYNEMLNDGKKITYYLVDTFISFGEPQNVKEYIFWSEYFALLVNHKDNRKRYDMINLIPAAGEGKRFIEIGYKQPKQLIKVLGEPMIIKSIRSLPKATKYITVILKEHADSYGLDKLLKEDIDNSYIVLVNKITDGMARTCLMAEHLLDKEKPLLISSCDYSFIYDDAKFEKLIKEEDPDVIIWSFKEYPDARLSPNGYAYLVVEDGMVKRISEKVPISEHPHRDPIVQGVFYFKSAKLFLWCVKRMIEKKITVNGEYYVATAINELIKEKKKVLPFEIDKYICWGTPLDLQTFEFWQRYFATLDLRPCKN